MSTKVQATGDSAAMQAQKNIYFAGATLAALTAVMYFLIGLNLVTVVELAPGEASGQVFFGIPAALAYTLGAVLLIFFRRRLLWILGAVLQVLVIAIYFTVAPDRTPSFEVWGILIRIAQFLLLGVLVYLIFRPRGKMDVRATT